MLPVRGQRRARRARTARPTTRGGRGAAGQPALGRGAGAADHAAAAAAGHAAPQPRPRACATSPCSSWAWSSCPADRGGSRRPRCGWTVRRRRRGPGRRRGVPAAPAVARRRGASPARPTRPAGGARAARPTGPTRSTPPGSRWTRPGWRRADRVRRAGGRARAVAPGPLRGAAGRRRPWSGTPAELHPAVCAALELPRRTCAMELNLDALPLPGGVDRAAAVGASRPALIDVALWSTTATPAGDVAAGAGRRGRRAAGVGAALRRVHRRTARRGRKSLAYKLTFRAPDRTLTGEEAVAARDAAVAEAARRLGAELRGG